MRRRTRCSVTTAPDDGSHMLAVASLGGRLPQVTPSHHPWSKFFAAEFTKNTGETITGRQIGWEWWRWLKSRHFFKEKIGRHRQLLHRVTSTLVTPLEISFADRQAGGFNGVLRNLYNLWPLPPLKLGAYGRINTSILLLLLSMMTYHSEQNVVVQCSSAVSSDWCRYRLDYRLTKLQYQWQWQIHFWHCHSVCKRYMVQICLNFISYVKIGFNFSRISVLILVINDDVFPIFWQECEQTTAVGDFLQCYLYNF